MATQYYTSKEKTVLYIRTPVEIAESIRKAAFKQRKSVNCLINELFESCRADWDRDNQARLRA